MSNEHNNSKKVVIGLVVGALVGAGVLYFINAARPHKIPILQKVGKTITEVGEALTNCEIDGFSDVAEEVKKSLPHKGDIMNGILNWISNSVNLLQKLKRGG
jgi:hypothetical protein